MRRQFLHLMTDNNNPIIDPPIDPMEAAFEQARKAKARGEVPIGAVLVDTNTGKILAAHGNRIEELCDPTAHAEMLAIRVLCALKPFHSPAFDVCISLRMIQKVEVLTMVPAFTHTRHATMPPK